MDGPQNFTLSVRFADLVPIWIEVTDVADFRAPGGTRARPPVGLEPTRPRAAESPAAGRHASGTDPIDTGRPGASARREYERLLARREAWIRSAHPHIGGFLLAVTDEPATTRAWALAARGEQRLARRLAKLHDDRILLLHDRGNSGSAANIDLLAVTPSGVYVISVKADKGRPRLKVEGGFIRPRTSRLVIGKRDGTDLKIGRASCRERV